MWHRGVLLASGRPKSGIYPRGAGPIGIDVVETVLNDAALILLSCIFNE